MSLTVSVADRAPVAAGENATTIWQFENAATDVPQPLEEIEKSDAFVPPIETFDICRAALPALDKVAV